MAASTLLEQIAQSEWADRFGDVRAVAPGVIESSGPIGLLGELCAIETSRGSTLAEIVAVDDRRVLLSPLDPLATVALGARVIARAERDQVPVGDGFGGRLVNALGEPIDDGPPIVAAQYRSIHGEVPRPLEREAPDKLLATGIRAIDGLLPLGRGQRVGIFAASGVGKTSLIEQLAAQIRTDRVVLCLVGERGREVETLWRSLSKRSDADRFTLVAATSDESAPLRARSVPYALALAEYWRGEGEHVLLVIDSMTRMAMALREVGLAAGSPPTVRAYTPNIYSALPRAVERCGGLQAGGAITGIMTVLSETDDLDDPIVELMKSLLDGHILLSRSLAEQGHFPAIDIARSVSRGAHKRVSKAQQKAITQVHAMLSAYDESRVMIESGVYRSGTNTMVDRAIASRPRLTEYLKQRNEDDIDAAHAVSALQQLIEGLPHA